MIAGGLALVNYGEPGPVWHSRALLAHAGGDDWAILTPDLDVYIETMSLANPDFTDFVYCGPTGAIPMRINPGHVYAFRPLTPADLGMYRQQGIVMAEAQLRAAGLPLPGGGPAAVAPAPAAPPANRPGQLGGGQVAQNGGGVADTWIALEDGGAYKRGDIVAQDPNPLPAGCLTLHNRGVLPAGAESILIKKVPQADAPTYRMEDLRVLPVEFDNQGIRRRDFATAVSKMDDAEPMGGGLQLSGPTTALKVLKDLRDQAFTAGTFHERWVRVSDIPRSDRSVYEHECLSRIMDSMITIDQLNVPSLQSAELIIRRLQVIREAHRISPGQPDYSSADHMMGWRFRRAGQGIDAGLAAHVANELKSEAAIAKEARKAREEMAARRKGRQPKGKAAEGGQES